MTADNKLISDAFALLDKCDPSESNRIAEVVRSVIPYARFSERYAIAALVLAPKVEIAEAMIEERRGDF